MRFLQIYADPCEFRLSRPEEDRARGIEAEDNRTMRQLRADVDKIRNEAPVFAHIDRAKPGRAVVVVPVYVKDAQGAHVRRCAQATESARRNARPYVRIILVVIVRNRDVSLRRDGPRPVCRRRFADEKPNPFGGKRMWPVEVAVKF